MFDYGIECRSYIGLPRPCNQVVYGQEVPPTYDFSRINAPLAVFTGTHQACTHTRSGWGRRSCRSCGSFTLMLCPCRLYGCLDNHAPLAVFRAVQVAQTFLLTLTTP